jgi:hypothetical protein
MHLSFKRLGSLALLVAFGATSMLPAMAAQPDQPQTKPAPPTSARPKPPGKPQPKPPGKPQPKPPPRPQPKPPGVRPPPKPPIVQPKPPPRPQPKPPVIKPPPRPPIVKPKPPQRPPNRPIWRPGNRPPIWTGPPNNARPPGGGWRPNYGWVPGYRPAWWGPTWRNRRPWLNNNRPWYNGTTVVAGLFGVSLFLNLVNQTIASNSDYVLVPNTDDVYLIVGSVYGFSGTYVSFNFVSYGEEYVEEGDCREFTINGSVPSSANLRAVFNAACIVAYGN